MKFFLLFCILTAEFSFSIHSQVLTGKIIDISNGNPLTDVAVSIQQHKEGILTGTDGSFILALQPGKYRVEARHIGYFPEVKEVVMNGKDTVSLNFQLKPKVYEQEQIVVTANKMERDKATVPVNVTVILQETITGSGESNILPVLSAEVPGLFVTERGVTGFGLAAGSAGKISIRGVGGSDASFPVLVLIDGQPQFMGLMGHPLPDTYVSDDLEKVEVIKGPASILYGTNAMGGAINLITRKPGTDGLSLNGKMTGGSFGTLKLHGSAGYSKKGSGGLISYQHDQTDGHRPSSAFRLDNASLRLHSSFGSRITGDATLSRSSFRASDPGSIYGSAADFAHNSHWVDIVRTNCFLSLSDRFSFSEGGVKAYFLWGDHNMYDGWKSHDENRGISIYQGFRIIGNSLVHIGLDMKKYGGKGISPSLGNKSGQHLSVEETGAYLMVDRSFFSKLSLNAGIRWDHHSGFGATWIPQFGAACQLSDNTNVKVWISKGFRNPSIRELYLFPTANPDLKPESMWNHELTISQGFAGRKGNIELTGYILNGENLILTVPNPTAPPPVKNANTGEFNHKGFETTIRYSVNDNLSVNGSYSFLHMDRPKVSSPVHQLFAGGEYHREKVRLSVTLRHIAKLYTLTGSQNVTQTFTLLNSRFAFQLNRHAGLFVSGENLLDQVYQMQYGYPMPGITFFGGLSLLL